MDEFLLTPGPVQLSEKTRLEGGRQMIGHRKEEFKKILYGLEAGLQKIRDLCGCVLALSFLLFFS